MDYTQLVKEIRTLALAARRNPDDIALVVVTKMRPWDQVRPVYDAGCRLFGESRIQEALPKMELAPPDIQWHLIGSLQKNKVKKAVGRFTLIHSVDSFELAEKISQCSEEMGVVSRILLQVNTSGEATKHGLTSDEWQAQFERILLLPCLSVEGLMTIGPNVKDSDVIRHSFTSLREFRERLNNQGGALRHLSMGMSHDYPIAIQEGATLLRIGTAVFKGVN